MSQSLLSQFQFENLQLTFGSEKRHLSSWLDGFAKLHSFKFDGRNVYFSGKMIESTTYMDSLEAGELVPQITLNKLKNPDEEWTLLEMEKIGERSINMFFGDMTHNAVSFIYKLFPQMDYYMTNFGLPSMIITILDCGGWVQKKIPFTLLLLTFHIRKGLIFENHI